MNLYLSTTPNPGTCVFSGNVKANLDKPMTANDDTIIIGQINYENVDNTKPYQFHVVNSEDLEIHLLRNFEYEMLSFTTQVINGEYNIELHNF